MLEQLDMLLQKHFNIHHITLEDQGYFHRGHHPDRKGGHYAITLVSNDFNQLSSIQRHQKVYQALGMPSNENIHALTLNTFTIDEWQSKQSKD